MNIKLLIMNELTTDAKYFEMYVTERRILKLIDRMCDGQFLYASQFDIIFDYIKKNGSQTTMPEMRYVYEDGRLVRYEHVRDIAGCIYLGIFAKSENMENTLIFGEIGRNRITSITKRESGQLYYQ